MAVDSHAGLSIGTRRSPRVTVFAHDYAVAKAVARRIADLVSKTPRLVLGLPTGRTPIGLYRELVSLHRHGVDFSQVTTFNLDEFLGIPANHPGSYRSFMLAHKLGKGLSRARRDGVMDYLRPDGKSQVTVEYDGDRPIRVDTVVVSTQHSDSVTNEKLREDITEKIIKQVIPERLRDPKTRFLINPTGRFVVGGPHGDAGLTGRKIIVDTYGGAAPHGGGAFSGKDPTKVDRSACYMARYVAKNVVAAGLASRCMVQLAYAIGVAEPVSVLIDTFNTGLIDDDKISEIVRGHFKLTPKAIIETLDLRRPIYKKTAAFGHFGRTEPEFSWERTDKAEAIRADAGIASADAVKV